MIKTIYNNVQIDHVKCNNTRIFRRTTAQGVLVLYGEDCSTMSE